MATLHEQTFAALELCVIAYFDAIITLNIWKTLTQ